MSSLRLGIDSDGVREEIGYEYKCRTVSKPNVNEVYCSLPPIKTRVSFRCGNPGAKGYVSEGYAFSPMFTLGYETDINESEVAVTWLRLEREN